MVISLFIFSLLLLLSTLATGWVAKPREEGDTTGGFAALRKQLHVLEDVRLRELKEELTSNGIHVQGFFHFARLLPHWLEVFSEQLRLLDGYHRDVSYAADHQKPLGVMDIAEKLTIYEMTFEDKVPVHADISMEDVVRLYVHPSYHERVQFKRFPSIDRSKYSHYVKNKQTDVLLQLHRESGLTLGEYPTITGLHEHCKAEVEAGRQSIVFYMHLKSAHMLIDANTVANRTTATPFWREFMNTLNIEYSSICLRALMSGSSVCGSLYRHLPTSHFAGNFFWASCNHVAQLAPLPSPVTDFEAAEFFLMRTHDEPKLTVPFATTCAYEAISMKKRFYKEAILPIEYMKGVGSALQDRRLPTCGMFNSSVLCLHDDKNAQLYNNSPCLSVRTKPDPSLRNHYNVSFSNIKTFRWDANGSKKKV